MGWFHMALPRNYPADEQVPLDFLGPLEIFSQAVPGGGPKPKLLEASFGSWRQASINMPSGSYSTSGMSVVMQYA